MPFFLKILAAPQAQRIGDLISLPEGETLAGRSSPPALLLLDGAKVSKKHCVFKVTGPELRVDDLRSANGVFVNGQATRAVVLKVRDRLVIGEFVLEVVVK